jgi:hypothetical protein
MGHGNTCELLQSTNVKNTLPRFIYWESKSSILPLHNSQEAMNVDAFEETPWLSLRRPPRISTMQTRKYQSSY